MKTPIRHVLLQASLFIVQFSTRCLKIPSQTFFIKNQPQTDASEAFVKSHSRVSSTSSLRLLTSFTFVLQSTSEQKFLMIFCYIDLLFTRHSESERTLLSSRPTAQRKIQKTVQKSFLKKFSEKFFQEYNCSSPKPK